MDCADKDGFAIAVESLDMPELIANGAAKHVQAKTSQPFMDWISLDLIQKVLINEVQKLPSDDDEQISPEDDIYKRYLQRYGEHVNDHLRPNNSLIATVWVQ